MLIIIIIIWILLLLVKNLKVLMFQKNFELYEGMSPSLVFQLSHNAMGAMVFCADNDNFAEKWTNALREATTLSESSA